MKKVFWLMPVILCVMSGVAYAANVCRVYSCDAGYYAASETICYRCPSLTKADGGTQYGLTSSAGMNAITSCYAPTGVKYKDNTGQFEFTSNCNYSK